MSNVSSPGFWRPTAAWQHLNLRANILAKIRHFFAERHVLEVETPILASASVTDPHLHSMSTEYQADSLTAQKTFYLQTSPEFAMKRLLAAGSGPIYQICKAFRDGESGRYHNPEFSMLEWYRPGFDHHRLMDEMDVFLQTILGCSTAERLSYAEAFIKYLGINPHTATVAELKDCSIRNGLNSIPDLGADKDAWLHLLISHKIEPYLGQQRPCFLYDFPSSQAALARIRDSSPPVAERFEVYLHGIELANGFHELANADEQLQRFRNDLQRRQALNLPTIPIDNYLIDALAHGLPDCAGVALGIDRLIMLAAQAKSIDEVIAFPITRI